MARILYHSVQNILAISPTGYCRVRRRGGTLVGVSMVWFGQLASTKDFGPATKGKELTVVVMPGNRPISSFIHNRQTNFTLSVIHFSARLRHLAYYCK